MSRNKNTGLCFSIEDQWSTVKLASPMVVSQLLFSISPFINTMLSARLGRNELMAQALIFPMFFVFVGLFRGVLSSISIFISRLNSDSGREEIAPIVQMGLILSIIMGGFSALIMWFAPSLLTLLGQDDSVIMTALPLFHIWSFVMILLNFELVIVEFLLGLGNTKIIMVVSLIEIPMNIFLKYSLVYGLFGFPFLGFEGLAYSTLISMLITSLVLLFYLLLSEKYKAYKLYVWRNINYSYIYDLFRLGYPIAVSHYVETGYFLVLTVILGYISVDLLAANQIAVQYVWVIAALQFGASQAVTVRVGNCVGEGNMDKLYLSSSSSIVVIAYFSIIMLFLLVSFPDFFVKLDLNIKREINLSILSNAVSLLRFAGIYVFVDGIRIILNGILRAHKETKYIMYTNVISFWFVSFFVGAFFLFTLKLGGISIWLSLITGALVGVLLLLYRILNMRYLVVSNSV